MKDWIAAHMISTLTPVIVPLLVLLAKKAITVLPKWTLPILAPILGALLDALSGWTTGQSLGGVAGALLGLAAVGVREIVDQIRKALAGG